MENNTHRTLKELAVSNAWFDPLPSSPNRYSLHVNVTFREERLGGEPDSDITFRVSLKQCQVVVVLPENGRFLRSDPRSIAMTPPAKPRDRKVTKSKTRGKSWSLGGAFSKKGVDVNGKAEMARGDKEVQEVSEHQSIPVLYSLHGQSKDGFPCWYVHDENEERLRGSLWDAANEPRMEVIDRRSEERREKDQELGFPPEAKIEIRCKREDIAISDICFKDPEMDRKTRSRPGYSIRLKAAEAFLRTELLREGLRVGDLSDIFSDLSVAEMIVPIDG